MRTQNLTSMLVYSVMCLLIASCAFNFSSKPCTDKTPKKETRALDKFSEIDLGVAGDVQLIQGTTQKFEIEGATCDLENITTKINGSKLSIENESNISGQREKVTI